MANCYKEIYISDLYVSFILKIQMLSKKSIYDLFPQLAEIECEHSLNNILLKSTNSLYHVKKYY